MRKTFLHISLSGFVAAALLLASCEQVEQPSSYQLGYTAIGSPENLTLTPFTGVNLLTWDPVVDANS
jgi:hypothetical protein